MNDLAPRRRLILDAALDMFTTSGYDATSVGDIARELGISKSAISYHFPKKEDLAEALANPYLDAVDGLLDRHPEPTWPSGARALFTSYFELLLEYRDLAIWVDTDRAVARHKRIAERRTEAVQRLVSALVGETGASEDEARAVAAVGGLWRPLRELDREFLHAHKAEIVDAALVSFQPLEG